MPKLHTRAALAVLAPIAAASPAYAKPASLPANFHWGRCLLKVDGKAYLSGRCAYSFLGGSSFIVEGPRQDFAQAESGKPMAEMVSTDHFAQANVRGNVANGFWNKDIRDMHAQDPLGVLRRKGACWVNAKAQLCLWKK